MKLKEYLDGKPITHREFAEKLGIHLHSLKNIIYEKRKPGLGLALQIEEITGGKVCPRDFVESMDMQTKPKRKYIRKKI